MNKKNVAGTVGIIAIVLGIVAYSWHTALLTNNKNGGLAAATLPAIGGSFVQSSTGTSAPVGATSCALTPVGEKLFVTGGVGNNYLNDVWSTVNGASWVQETQGTSYPSRYGAQLLYVNRTFYLFEGQSTDGRTTAVYTSKNAKDWAFNGMLPSYHNPSVSDQFSVAYFNNKFWLVANDGSKHSLWYSNDAAVWTKITSTSWPGVVGETVFLYVLDSKLWLLGIGPTTYNPYQPPGATVWSSVDGYSWNYESHPNILTNNVPGMRNYSTPFVSNGKVWIISGHISPTIVTNDVYSSDDGKTWTQVTNAAPFAERQRAVNIGFQNKLWTIGGIGTSSQTLKDEWYSSDGIKWTKETFSNNPPLSFLNRQGATGIVAPLYSASSNAPDLYIMGGKNSVQLTAARQSNVEVAKWTLRGGDDGLATFSGTIRLEGLSFTGTKMSDGTSSLEHLHNLRLRVNGVNYGYLSNFTGPFYDSANPNGIPKDLVFQPTGNVITLTEGQSKVVTLTADVWDAPDIFMIFVEGQTYNTYLNGTPCSVYGDHSGYISNDTFVGFPGGTVYPL